MLLTISTETEFDASAIRPIGNLGSFAWLIV